MRAGRRAALLAGAVGLPLENDIFQLSAWLPGVSGLVMRVAVGVLIVGFTRSFLKLLALRSAVYHLDDFKGYVDSMVYGLAVGLGYAAMLNWRYVFDLGGVDLMVGFERMTSTVLVQGAAGAMGAFLLVQMRYEQRLWWFPTALAAPAAIEGVFVGLRATLSTASVSLTSTGARPWLTLGLAGARMLGVMATLRFFVEQLKLRQKASLIGRGQGEPDDRP